MNILQIVTYVGRGNPYGGPVSVATNQGRALREAGHVVEVWASTDEAQPPQQLASTGIRTFRGFRLTRVHRFAGLVSPRMWMAAFARASHFDVVHIHLARDLVTLPAAVLALMRGSTVVVQTHGMIIPKSHPLFKLFDLVVTRPVLRRCSEVLCLTELERKQIQALEPRTRTTILRNGVPTSNVHALRGPEILFAARLHERKRPGVFVEAALAVAPSHPQWRFTIAGADEGLGQLVARRIAGHQQLRYVGALEQDELALRMASAAAYILPSLQEPFPMTVLEAMAVGTPVVITDDCGLAATVSDTRSGIVVGRHVNDLAAAIELLITDEPMRTRMGANARRTIEREFAMPAIADQLVQIYARPRTSKKGTK